MNCVERVKEICKLKKIPISRLERDLGYSNGYIGQLRKGVFPADRLVEIANYLSVSVEYLLGTEVEKAPVPNNENGRTGPKRNIIKVAGRDGSYIEKHLTDEQIAALKILIDQLPDVPEGL